MSTGASTLKSTIKATSFISGRMQTLLRFEGVTKSLRILFRLEGGHTGTSENRSIRLGDQNDFIDEEVMTGEPKTETLE